MDLNIENYDLDDILNLFKMPRNFGEDDVKAAKKIVKKVVAKKSAKPTKKVAAKPARPVGGKVIKKKKK
jgi:hypothetical protein